MRSRLFRLIVLLVGMIVSASPRISDAQVTHALLPAVETKAMKATSHLNTFFALNEAPSQNVELLGQMGGATEAIFVQGNYAYIGEGPRLAIFDISNPSSPLLLGKTDPMNGLVHDIVVVGNIAYVVVSI